MRVGGPTEIVLDAYPTERRRGKVQQVTPKVDRAKAMVMVRVGFVDDMTGVLPEMSARVSFLSEALDAAAVKQPSRTVVPKSAVAAHGGGQVVFVLESDRVRRVPVKLGEPLGRGFVLLQGPAAGTRVVASPPPSLEDGGRFKEQSR